MSKSKTSIFLVDDHPLVREWLTNLIHQQPDLEVCGEADAPAEALAGIAAKKPAVAIVDIQLKGGSGLQLIKNIKAVQPGTAVIVLSMHEEAFYAERAVRAGARGYIMKRETAGKVIDGVRRILSGELYVSDKVKALFAEKFAGGKAAESGPAIETLSDRELEVFQLLGQGRETRQIAEALHVSMKTVQAFCARIKEKLGLNTATELLREAVRWHESRQSD